MPQIDTGMPQKYPLALRALHWILAILILGMIAMGLIMTDLPKEAEYRGLIYGLHKSFGVTIFVLALIRLAVRLRGPLPADAPGVSREEYLLAHLAHYLFYALMLAIPLVGVLMSNSFDHGVSWFGLPLPRLVGADKELGALMADWHEWLAYGILALAALHVAGVIKHYLVDRQNLLKRMW